MRIPLRRLVGQPPLAEEYRPRYVSGFREKNTFIDYEVSNHLYGIAIDIDSGQNHMLWLHR